MSKTEVEETIQITTAFLRKHKYFMGLRGGTISWKRGGIFNDDKSRSVGVEVSTINEDNYLRIHYTQTERNGDKTDFDYKIPLTTTPCHFGGKRYWFVCPWYKAGKYCGRRVGVLYKEGDYFACRHCNELTYASRKVNRRYHMFPLFEVISLEQKIEELRQSITKHTYQGKPTKKFKRLMKLLRETSDNYETYAKTQKYKL